MLTPELSRILRAVDTPTICNALELVQRKERPMLAAAHSDGFDLAALERAMTLGDDIH